MPALNMKAKSTTTCKRDESYPHVSQKSNKISKLSCSMVRVTHEPVDLNTLTHMPENGFKNEVASKEHENCKIQMSSTGDKTAVRTCLSWEFEDSSSIEKRDSLPFYHSSSLETMFSPFTGSNDVHCSLFDAVGREQIVPVPPADDNNSSNNQTYHMLDSYIYEMCLTGFSTDRLSVFDDSVNCDILSDHEFDGPNLIYDVTEGFMLFPSHEETVEATDSHYGGSCEDAQQNSDYSWFHHMCHQTKPFTQDVGHSSLDLDEVDYSDPESFIRNFPELSDESSSLPALVSKETSKRKSITLVLDLDETLVHSTIEPCDGADFTIQVFFDKKEHTVYVRQRPFLQTFLDRVSEMFEIVIFTASQSIYAEKLLDVLDPDKKNFSRRVYRESCIFSDGSYTKDLTVLGVDLAKVVIVDNSPQVFRLQADNGIPIESWFDDPSDSALMSLLPFLETLVDVDDVRPIVANKFRVRD